MDTPPEKLYLKDVMGSTKASTSAVHKFQYYLFYSQHTAYVYPYVRKAVDLSALLASYSVGEQWQMV